MNVFFFFVVIQFHPKYLAPIILLIISKLSWGSEYDHKEETWHHLPIKNLCGWNWEVELDSRPPDEAAHRTDAEHPAITNNRQGLMYLKFRDITKFHSIHALKQLNSVLINLFYLQSVSTDTSHSPKEVVMQRKREFLSKVKTKLSLYLINLSGSRYLC